MHNLLLKLTGYGLKLDLYFKIFPGLAPYTENASACTASGTLGICLESQVAHNHTEGGFRIYPLPYLTRARDDGLCISPALQ